MRRRALPCALGLLTSGLLACGSRTGLHPGALEDGAAGTAGSPAVAACLVSEDCPPPPAGQCGMATCNAGVCALELGPVCDDGNPCTIDSCESGACKFVDGRVDADGDGAFASGTAQDPKAALGCGQDCDDSNASVYPGALERCDALDNDCDGVVDDDTRLLAPAQPPTRVSPSSAMHAEGAGLAFNGTAFGATISSRLGRSEGQFQLLDSRGKLLGQAQRIARVNAESYGGPLLWAPEQRSWLTAYQDARQDGNYEIYYDLLNSAGQRVAEDLRVTNADDYSLRPSVLWTGSEALLIWDDRRFEGTGDASAIFGQRVSADGRLLGANLRLSPPGTRAENASATLSADGVGIAFVALDAGLRPSIQFMTTSRTLEQPSALTAIDFADADSPVVTAVDDVYVVTFHQQGDVAVGPSIFGVVIGKNGVVRGPLSMTAGGAHARGNATYSYGNRFVMVWADDRSGVYQLYAQTFDKTLAPLTPLLRVTATMTATRGPVIAPASDGGLGVLYTDEGTGASQAFFTRLDCQDISQQKTD